MNEEVEREEFERELFFKYNENAIEWSKSTLSLLSGFVSAYGYIHTRTVVKVSISDFITIWQRCAESEDIAAANLVEICNFFEGIGFHIIRSKEREYENLPLTLDELRDSLELNFPDDIDRSELAEKVVDSVRNAFTVISFLDDKYEAIESYELMLHVLLGMFVNIAYLEHRENNEKLVEVMSKVHRLNLEWGHFLLTEGGTNFRGVEKANDRLEKIYDTLIESLDSENRFVLQRKAGEGKSAVMQVEVRDPATGVVTVVSFILDEEEMLIYLNGGERADSLLRDKVEAEMKKKKLIPEDSTLAATNLGEERNPSKLFSEVEEFYKEFMGDD
jgi:hypothetical protein